jgi:hypothetical protein
MMLQTIFVPLLLGLATQSLPADPRNGTVFDEQFSSLIQEAIDTNNVTGMSVGVLLSDGGVEFGVWGNRTESGEKIVLDVWFILSSFYFGG